MKKKVRKTRRQLIAEKLAAAKQLVDKANSLANPLEDLYSFHEYAVDDYVIQMSCIRAKDADPECLSWIFDIMEKNMKDMYNQSSWGWDMAAKQKELTEPAAWYLIASSNKKFLGFSHFRFDLDYGESVLYCYELQLEPSVRRKGLGRFMMMALETMAFQNQMQKVVLTALKCNLSSIQFFSALGYKLDSTSPPASEQMDYVILSKHNLRR